MTGSVWPHVEEAIVDRILSLSDAELQKQYEDFKKSTGENEFKLSTPMLATHLKQGEAKQGEYLQSAEKLLDSLVPARGGGLPADLARSRRRGGHGRRLQYADTKSGEYAFQGDKRRVAHEHEDND